MRCDVGLRHAAEEGDVCRAPASIGRWLTLAVGVLFPAGLFALAVVVGRTPPFSRFVTDPGFFRRCLVVHVDLALLVWAFAFTATLFARLPSRAPSSFVARVVGPALAALGVASLILGAGVSGAEPVLSNYVPAIDTPLFLVGLGLFALGLGATFLDPARMLPANEAQGAGPLTLPPSARPGARAAGLGVLLALATFALSIVTTPRGLLPLARYELMFWGGGHVLQVALEAAMLTVWITLLASAMGRDPLDRRVTSGLFGLLVLPLLASPWLVSGGTTTPLYREGFTALMRWGIFPVTLTLLGLCVRSLWRASRDDRALLRDPRVAAFAVSAALTVTGFALGAMIRGSTTLVPAHYHAAAGAVTVAFMAEVFATLEGLGLEVPTARLRAVARWQPAVYGLAQLVLAGGFALAGMPRKTYGAEQHVRTASEYVGLGLMGLGGLLAVIAGVAFLVVVAATWWRRASSAHGVAHTNGRPHGGLLTVPAEEDRDG